LVSLLMHIPVFVGIFTFRRYIIAATRRSKPYSSSLDIRRIRQFPHDSANGWTGLMAAGYVLSYFNWLSLLFLT
jgi:hypothetical protein